MKRSLLFLLFVIAQISAFSTTSFNQKTILIDTLTQGDTIQIAPYLKKSTGREVGNFAVISKDSIAFQTYAAFNVLNTLRGHVPNLIIGSNSSTSVVGLRYLESMLVIDGLPYNADISSYYNLNAFEYQTAYAISSGNSTSVYGGTGANGAFLLQSKNGENFVKPTFEFTSSPTMTWSDGTTFSGTGAETITQWQFTNALSYQQDYGVVDARVSYVFTMLPDANDNQDLRSGVHSLRINTGIAITPRLKARLILDDYYTKTMFSSGNSSTFWNNTENRTKNLQGNLQLTYRLLDWLTLSSQSSITELNNKSRSSSGGGMFPATDTNTDQTQNRTFTNFFASIQKSLHPNISATAFGGIQYDKMDLERYMESQTTVRGETRTGKTTSLFGGAGLQFKNFLFGDFNYRFDKFSVFGPEHDETPTYSFCTSFIFSDAFAWKNSWFTFGKLRASVGKISLAPRQGYPQKWSSELPSISNPDLHAESKKMQEYGMDLAFINNRIVLNASYFFNNSEDAIVNIPLPGGIGYGSVWANIGELYHTGWEVVLGGIPIKKDDLTLNVKLIWSTLENRVEDISGSDNGNRDDDNTRILGNVNPDWRGSFLNQIVWKNFFASFLVNVRKGGDIIVPYFDNGSLSILIEDGTQAKLQDISLGYRFSSGLLKKIRIQNAQVSMSGRNLWTIYSESEMDTESPQILNGPQQAISLNLSLMF